VRLLPQREGLPHHRHRHDRDHCPQRQPEHRHGRHHAPARAGHPVPAEARPQGHQPRRRGGHGYGQGRGCHHPLRQRGAVFGPQVRERHRGGAEGQL